MRKLPSSTDVRKSHHRPGRDLERRPTRIASDGPDDGPTDSSRTDSDPPNHFRYAQALLLLLLKCPELRGTTRAVLLVVENAGGGREGGRQ